ncbi:MAG: NAD(P)/FAD-dependent oxidoreductase [Oscillospiraceae bacterium]
MERIYDAVIVGGGPGGYTAALYCARAGLDTVVLEKLSAGGQMALTQQIDNYPGFPEGVDGFELGERMRQGAERFGAETVLAEAVSARLAGAVKTVESSEGTFRGRTVILATGAEPRPLGLPGEKELAGRGVHYCAACDGMAYRDRTVAVVGGGNTAAGEALLLSRLCKKVWLIHRRDALRAARVYHEPLRQAGNIGFCFRRSVLALLYGDRLTGLRLRDTDTGAESDLPCDGVFVSIGRAPASERFRAQLAVDEAGYIRADESTRTSVPGVFAVGDVRTKALRQIVTAVADGAAASYYAEEYLARGG